MVTLFKALPFGIFLTVLVCLFLGSGGSSGGILNIRSVHWDIQGFDLHFYWSWAMFVIGTTLAGAILWMMGD